MLLSLVFVVQAFTLWLLYAKTCGALNIALHAQVHHSSGKIVGSVITTEGMKQALLKYFRSYTCPDILTNIQVFYPFHYPGFFAYKWDLIIIEGWFPTIHDFIRSTRLASPHAVILFFCLDPVYPGLDLVLEFDVDGYLTNSRKVEKILNQRLPTYFVMLAADPEAMKPIPESNDHISLNTINQDNHIDVVYVGAGGNMINYKKQLLMMLKAASNYKLHIYGSKWNEIDQVKYFWKGSLPQHELSTVYSKAKLVIASTIDSQSEYDMINNRVFEALSCGAVVLSEYAPTLESFIYPYNDYDMQSSILQFSLDMNTSTYDEDQNNNMILFVKTEIDVIAHIDTILRNQTYQNMIQNRSRRFILSGHTWSHRIIEILDLFQKLRNHHFNRNVIPEVTTERENNDILLNCSFPSKVKTTFDFTNRYNIPKLLVVLADKWIEHSDFYQIIYPLFINQISNDLSKSYDITILSDIHFLKMYSSNIQNSNFNNRNNLYADSKLIEEYKCLLEYLKHFEVVVLVEALCSPLEQFFRKIPPLILKLPSITLTDTGKTISVPLSAKTHLPVHMKQMIQKRVLVNLGFNPLYLESCLNSINKAYSDIESCKNINNNNNSSICLNSSSPKIMNVITKFYDVVFYKDYYDLDLFIQNGLYFENVRLQHLFGISLLNNNNSNNSNDCISDQINISDLAATNNNHNKQPTIDIYKSRKYELVVCVYRWKLLCKNGISQAYKGVYEQYKKAITKICENDNCTSNDSNLQIKDENVYRHIRLLLIGGTLSNWLQAMNNNAHTLFFTQTILQITTHTTMNYTPRTDIYNLFKFAIIIHYCHGHSQPKEIHLFSQKHVSNYNSTENLTPMKVLLRDSTEDIIWPIVLTTQLNIPVFLLSSNTHLLQVAQNCFDWSHKYFKKSVQNGFRRLYGLISSQAELLVKPTSMSLFSNMSDISIETNDDVVSSCKIDTNDYEQEKGIDMSSFISTESDENIEYINIVHKLIIELEFKYFTPGINGELCVIYENHLFSVPNNNITNNISDHRHINEDSRTLICLITDVHTLLIESSMKIRRENEYNYYSHICSNQQNNSKNDNRNVATGIKLSFALHGTMFKDTLKSYSISLPYAEYSPYCITHSFSCNSNRTIGINKNRISSKVSEYEDKKYSSQGSFILSV